MTLQNVTVIIPAHNRPERLRRLLDYYSRTPRVQQFTGTLPALHSPYRENIILPSLYPLLR